MQTNRFDAIAAELERLAAEIAAINRQPFDLRIDLQSNATKVDTREDGPSIQLRDWHLER